MSPNPLQKIDAVFLHGINNSPISWAGVTANLEGYRVSAPLLPPIDDIDELARNIIATLPPQFVLVGHSFGGYVALSLLEQIPERITGFVLINSIDSADTNEMAVSRREKVQQALSDGYEALAEAATPHTYLQSNLANESLMSSRAEAIAEYGVDRFGAHQEASATRPDRSSVFRDANVPKLVIAAANDRVIPTSKQESMAKAAGALFTTIAGGEHMLPAEQPEAVATTIREWVQQQQGCSGCSGSTDSVSICAGPRPTHIAS